MKMKNKCSQEVLSLYLVFMDQVQRTTNVPQTQLSMVLIQIMEQQLCLNGINSRLHAIL